MQAFRLDLAKDLLEGLVTAGIHLDASPGCLLYDSTRKILHGMKESCTGIVGLLLMFRSL
jgi:hypothetical protein